MDASARTLPSRRPTLFLSHGSPMTALEPGDAGAYMQRLGRLIDHHFGRPRAILAVSAHTLTREPVLLAGARHEAVHDFGGFPEPLYRLRYDAPGAPPVAERAAGLLREAGWPAHVLDEGGLDHGIWTPLRYIYPDADVPVVPLGFAPNLSPRRLHELGTALAPLADEGVLVMGSGSITHNLRLWGGGRPELGAPELPESKAFRDWFAAHSAAGDWEALWDYRAQAPHAAFMHPTDEHLLPWYVAAGAGRGEAVRVHESITYGCIGMDAYAFGPGAARLADAAQPAAAEA